jgi:16S rRNA (cytidine1402-2'-O)-methyltransferase
MAEVFGNDRGATIVREITKTYEETIRGTLSELAKRFGLKQALGEIVIIIEGVSEGASGKTGEAVSSATVTIDDLIEAGVSLKQASALIAKLTGASRRDIYQEALKHRRETDAK